MLLAFTPIAQPDAAYLAATTKLSSAAADGANGISSVADASQTISFSTTMIVVTTSHWGQPPQVESSSPRLFSPDNGTAGSYILSFSSPVKIFGVELSQDYFNTTDTLHAVFYDGATQVGSIDQSVTMTQNPSAPNGARLFAAETDGQFTHVVLSKTSASVGPLDMSQIRYALAAPSVYTWDGGGVDANWTTPENWAGDVAPTPGSSLVFPESVSKLASHNDFAAGTAFHDLTIESSGYDVTGNAIGLDGAIKASFPGASSTLSLPVQLLASATIDVTGGGTLLYRGDLSGSGFGVTKVGPGTVVLFGEGTESGLTGALTVAGGTVHVFSDDALPAGTVSLAGGTTLLIDGATTVDNDVALSGGATIDVRADATLSGRLSGPGRLTKAGARALTLANAGNEATATGGVFVESGTLAAAQDDALPAGTITLAGGATLRITADTTVDNAIALTGGAWIDAATAFTLSGPISGGGGFTKLGAGTLTLQGDTDYAGTTVIDAGRLVVDGSIADGGSLQVNTGATLGGLGRVPSVTVAVGGTVAPGNSPATLTAGDAAFAAGSTFDVELNGVVPGAQYDQLIALEAVDLGGATLVLSLGGGFVPAAGDVFTILRNDGGGAVVGTFAGLPEGAKFTVDGVDFRVSYTGGDGNDVVLRAVAPATVTVSASANPSVFGGVVSFSVNVSAATSTPTGSVTLLVGGTPLATLALDASGNAVFPTAGMSAGAHALSISYTGDSAHDPAEAALAGGQVVLPAATTTSVTTGLSPSIYGQQVTFTALVSAAGLTPAGTVDFLIDGRVVAAGVVVSNGVATFSTSSLVPGTHAVTARFEGGTNFVTSTGTLEGGQVVGRIETATILATIANPVIFGQPVSFVVTLSDPRATGMVELFDGAVSLGTAGLQDGIATFTVSTLGVGGHSIKALYAGDDFFVSSTSELIVQGINRAAATLKVAPPSTAPVAGQPVPFAIVVSPVAPAAGAPGGVVEVLVGSRTTLVSLDAGRASVELMLDPGASNVSFRYLGDGNFSGSAPVVSSVVVNPAATVTALTTTSTSTPVGQPVTFTATVSPVAPGAWRPSGVVTFLDGDVVLGSATLVDGQASLTVPGLSAGVHSIRAVYGGSAGHEGSSSSALAHWATQSADPAPVPPKVSSLRRFGIRAQPTRLVLTFTEPMAPTPATDTANYILLAAGVDRRFGTADDQRIGIRGANLDPTGRVVTLSPARRLGVLRTFELVVNGTSPSGLSDTSGQSLDGAGDGKPGSDFAARINRSTFAGPVRAFRRGIGAGWSSITRSSKAFMDDRIVNLEGLMGGH